MRMFSLIAFLVFSALAFCSCLSTTQPTTALPTISSSFSQTDKIVANILSAVSKVATYQLNTEVINTQSQTSDAGASTRITWKGVKSIDLVNKSMMMDMSIDSAYLEGQNSEIK